MALKVTNETKVGALAAISITLLILGFNFLKGKNLSGKSRYINAKFLKIDGLQVANPVSMNGLIIGSVYSTEPTDKDMTWINVKIRIDEDVNIPDNSMAKINSSLMGSTSIEIAKGTSLTHLPDGDTIKTVQSAGGLLASFSEQLGPTQKSLDAVLHNVDSLLYGVNNIINAKAQEDLRATIHQLNLITQSLNSTLSSVNGMLATNGHLNKSLANIEQFSTGLAAAKTNIPAITANLETTTQQLSKLELDKTINQLNTTIAGLNKIIESANNPNNTLGAVLNDKKMYNNLNSTLNSMNLLMQDLRLNPKRYVNVSVFGKKDKSEPLMKPMAEDSVTQEQYKN